MRKLLLAFIALPIISFAQRDYTKLVNPFIGTGGHGHTYPGATMPFGMMQLSPDSRMADWDGSSGYHYSDSLIYGFSHTHLSGTGIPDYCDILVMPFVGQVRWDNKDYRSSFSHKNEKASPGYYEVLLDKYNIKAQLTTSTRSGIHQYTFPANTDTAGILIDLHHRDKLLDVNFEVAGSNAIRGYRRSQSWAKDQRVYFYIEFDHDIVSIDTKEGSYAAGWRTDGNMTEAWEEFGPVKKAIKFKLTGNRVLKCKVGISAVSDWNAKQNTREIKDWNFDQVREAAKTAWNKELSKIEVKGGTTDQQVSFYTALYHTMSVPNIFQDMNGQYRGTDNQVHTAKGFTNYSVFSLWDTYRAYHPLMTILEQKKTTDWVNTFLNHHRNGGMLPVWELAANETFCMIGYHSVPVIVDAYQKGLFKGDEKELLDAMTSYAESNRFGLDHYRHYGYISNEKEHESVSKTLEYAYDDWCIAQFAKMTGNDNVYQRYMRRAQYYKNVFDPVSKHMRGKIQAMWYSPFDAREINNFYTEGNSWQYTFAVPQDIETLIDLHGGADSFASKLNELFTTSSQTTGREQPDVTGLIGQYAQGNEPSHHMAYLFNYTGRPWRTQELVHRINNEFYKNSPDGLIGNEDCGQMSAWFIFSAMGFYPVCPGNGEYVLGTPLFDEVKINLENGASFTIKANRNSGNAFYVESAKLNGNSYNRSYLNHTDLMKGGSFEFTLSSNTNHEWGTAKPDRPHSKIEAEPIVAVPYADVASNKFRQSAMIKLSTITNTADIFYTIVGDSTTTGVLKYTAPFLIDKTATIKFYAVKDDKRSAEVSQQFYRIPGDISISVNSTVHPMYTAGGPEALIDGITGTINWRSGEWQSYFGTDLDAVIDLQKVKPIKYLGVHVLQDVSPWILYPKEVIFYTSTDGVNYTKVPKITNTKGQQMEQAEVQELGINVNLKARYVKVKVVNGGKLPAWHESAGNSSHLFIDEIIIR
jgi:predicted alpha-1,2-mannosidase